MRFSKLCTLLESSEDFLKGLDSIDYRKMADEAHTRWKIAVKKTIKQLSHRPRFAVSEKDFKGWVVDSGSTARKIVSTVAKENNIDPDVLIHYITRHEIRESKEDFLAGLETIDFQKYAMRAYYNWRSTMLSQNQLTAVDFAKFRNYVDAGYLSQAWMCVKKVADENNIQLRDLLAYILKMQLKESHDFLQAVNMSRSVTGANKAAQNWIKNIQQGVNKLPPHVQKQRLHWWAVAAEKSTVADWAKDIKACNFCKRYHITLEEFLSALKPIIAKFL